jgi:hypothetical protein
MPVPEKHIYFIRFFPSVISAFDIQLFRKNGICKNIPGEQVTSRKMFALFFLFNYPNV